MVYSLKGAVVGIEGEVVEATAGVSMLIGRQTHTGTLVGTARLTGEPAATGTLTGTA